MTYFCNSLVILLSSKLPLSVTSVFYSAAVDLFCVYTFQKITTKQWELRMKIKKVAAAIALTFAFSAVSHADVLPQSQKDSSWYSAAQTKLTTKTAQAQATQATKAKNVILFVGDGMGISTLTAARILQGQRNNQSGEEGYLSFEEFPYSAQVKTYNVDAQTPDSAGTMTAIISGVKTDVGVIGVDEDIERGVCSTVAGNELITATELAEIKGLSTGIISTARITHATPAATYAKSADRNWEDVSDMPEDAVTGGCEDIASQLVNFEKNLEARFVGTDVDGLDFVMGGGRRHFLPKDETANSTDAVSAIEGDRTDERNLVTEWQTQYPDATYVMDQTGFDAIADDATKVFGLFNESHMQYEADLSLIHI